MKMPKTIIFPLLIFLSFCKKDVSPVFNDCGTSPYTGPVKYYLTPSNKSLFNSYKRFRTLTFTDSVSHIITSLTLNPNIHVWDNITSQSQIQGDTVNIGERAGISYNIGTEEIGVLQYYFNAYPNNVDSLRIFLTGGNITNQYPTFTFFWTMSLSDKQKSSIMGPTPFEILDSVTFLSRTFHEVYLLRNGNSLSQSDYANDCYYTKANGVIAFTDKRYNRFWIRTNL